jgi:threonine/homoserine/homoserine lactone efflux protein
MWRANANLSQNDINNSQLSTKNLISQGYVTAVANPKGWAFMVSILPPFISLDKPIVLQFSVLLIIIMLSEIICMLIYANGGKGLKRLLNRGNNAVWLNRIAGSLLAGVGIWLALS